MALDLRRDEETLLVTNEHLDLSIHVPTLGMLLRRRSGPERLHGFRPRVLTEEGPLLPIEPMVDGHGQIRSRSGVAERIHVQTRLSPLLWLSLQLDIGEDWHGVVIDIELLNRGYTPLRVHALDPLWWSRPAGGELGLGHPRGKSLFFEMGHHTDTSPHYWPLGGSRGLRSLFGAHSERGPFTPPPAWGLQVSDTVASLCSPERTSLTLGFITAHRFLSFVQMRHRGSEVQELVASTFTEALALPPRARLRSERLWIGLDPPGSDGIAAWAQRAGAEMEAPTPLPAHPGGMLWSEDAGALASALGEAKALAIPGAFVELAGEALNAGDWSEPSAAASRLAPLAAQVREAGLAPRIALAPFVAPFESPLVVAHPEWVLRDAAGTPVRPAGPTGAARDLTVLDPTHPEVLRWLEEVGRALAGAGLGQLSLRDLESGALAGTRHDPAQGTAEAYRKALGALRQGLGSEGVLIGERAPLAASIGLLTVVRLSPSPERRGSAPDAASALRSVLMHAPLHQRLWLHELGPLGLDDAGREDSELDGLVGLTAICGASPVVRLGLEPTSEAGAHWLHQLVPPSGRVPERLAPWDPESPLCARFPDGGVLLLQLNTAGREQDLDIELAPLGLRAPLHAWDVLADQPVEVRDDRLRIPDVPGRGCALIRLAPRDARARVVSSTLHATGGGVEVSRLRSEPGGLTRLRLALPGQRRGTVRLALPSNEVLTLQVAFRESLELCASAERVEDSS